MRICQVILVSLFFGSSVLWAEDVFWQEIPREEVDDRLLSRRGHRLLNDEEYDWTHAKTEHFVIHFERKQFAQKVARMAEFFYEFISNDLGTAQDLTDGPSHIFLFRKAKSWEYFVEEYNVATEWAFSLVSGYTMYLQQADKRKASGMVLGHEMTHLIFNRFYQGRLPLWLNEGTAEWYGTFGYEAYKNTRRNKRSSFRRIKEVYPLGPLLKARAYPANPDAIESFYKTSKYLVGFLQINYPGEKFEPFLNDIVKGMRSTDALRKHYEVQSVDELDKDFRRFSR